MPLLITGKKSYFKKIVLAFHQGKKLCYLEYENPHNITYLSKYAEVRLTFTLLHAFSEASSIFYKQAVPISLPRFI